MFQEGTRKFREGLKLGQISNGELEEQMNGGPKYQDVNNTEGLGMQWLYNDVMM